MFHLKIYLENFLTIWSKFKNISKICQRWKQIRNAVWNNYSNSNMWHMCACVWHKLCVRNFLVVFFLRLNGLSYFFDQINRISIVWPNQIIDREYSKWTWTLPDISMAINLSQISIDKSQQNVLRHLKNVLMEKSKWILHVKFHHKDAGVHGHMTIFLSNSFNSIIEISGINTLISKCVYAQFRFRLNHFN